MQTEYIISSETIASIIHRLSSGYGDFEGFLYGTSHVVNSKKLKDDGTYEKKLTVTIHNVFISNAQKIILCSSLLNETLARFPQGIKVVGWISGRREVPAIPSVGDRSTFDYLKGLAQKFPTVISENPIFGLFVSRNSASESASDIEIGKSAMISLFEYKFFSPRERFTGIKVEIDNLKETKSRYNDIYFTYSLISNNSEQVYNKIK
jgi:hypothetical protein